MKEIKPFFESSYVFLNLFALVLLTSLLPFIVIEVNILNISIVTLTVLLLIYFYSKFKIYKVKLFETYIEIIRPFSKENNVFNNIEIVKINYIIGSSRSLPYFIINLKNKNKVMFVCDDRKEAIELIKKYMNYDFPIILNNFAIIELRKFGIKVDKKGVVIKREKKEEGNV